MKDLQKNKSTYTGIALAVFATIVWSGNFVVARGVIHQIPPVSLAFFRWATASVILMPFAWKAFQKDKQVIRKHRSYIFWTALTGVTLFNTFVYVAGHYTPAINLALIGTTSSPVFALLLAAVFLKERIPLLRLAGLAICLAGILVLLSGGSWEKLKAFHFARGDVWVLLGAFFFAVYNILVRRKPPELGSLSFLWIVFTVGAVLLLPAFVWEAGRSKPVQWNGQLAGIILYLGLGTSVLSFLSWNLAIGRLGAARTALFGNLIPIFSTLEAVWFLQEPFTRIHALSGVLVLLGLVLANLKRPEAKNKKHAV